jgi:hypothetical protein
LPFSRRRRADAATTYSSWRTPWLRALRSAAVAHGRSAAIRMANKSPSSRVARHRPSFSAMPDAACPHFEVVLAAIAGHVRKVQIVLQKSFWGNGQNFSGPLMPFARGDMGDHIVSRKNDHGASYGRYAVLQWCSRLKVSFCAIFGVVQFSTFATQSAKSGSAVARTPVRGCPNWVATQCPLCPLAT